MILDPSKKVHDAIAPSSNLNSLLSRCIFKVLALSDELGHHDDHVPLSSFIGKLKELEEVNPQCVQ